VSTPAAAKAVLLTRLRRAEQQVEALSQLKEQINEAIGQVDTAISGSVTGIDRQALAQLQANLDELDRLVRSMRAAVVEGRRFADSLG
jgi:transposase